MNIPDELKRESKLLRDRISKLSEAILRIGATLHIDTELREIVESAREPAGAECGVIATADGFVSSGITRKEHLQLTAWRDAPQFCEQLQNLQRTLRAQDVAGYLRLHGFSAAIMPSKPIQGTPMHHRGLHVGNFFVCGKKMGPSSQARTLRSWLCSRRRRRQSPTPVRSGTRNGRGRIWKP